MLTLSQIRKVERLDFQIANPMPRRLSLDQRMRYKKESFKELMKKSDAYIRWSNCYQGATNPIKPEKSTDPLYLKLHKAVKIARGKLDGLDGAIFSAIYEGPMILLEERRMDASTYVEMMAKSAQQIYEEYRKIVVDEINEIHGRIEIS